MDGWLGGLLAAALVYFLALKVPLPTAIISRFSPFTLLYFIGLVILFFLVFQIANRPLRTASGLFLTALVFALPLAIRLSTGLSNATVLGGFIPYKDGYYYYNSANMLLNGQPITANGLQGAFRPLFPIALNPPDHDRRQFAGGSGDHDRFAGRQRLLGGCRHP